MSIGKFENFVKYPLIKLLDPDAEVSTVNLDSQNNYVRDFKYSLKKSPKCPIGVPEQLRKEYRKTTLPDRIPNEEKYKDLAWELHNGYVSNRRALEAYKSRLEHRPIILLDNSDGTAITFNGRIKGCPEYNSYLENRIRECCSPFDYKKDFVFFFTNTYAVNSHGRDIIQAWKKFSREERLILRAIKRAFGASYVDFFESTFRGYPHSHVIISVPHQKAVELVGNDCTACKLWVKLMNFIRNRVTSPNFGLVQATYGKIEMYLSKYVTKTLSELANVSHNQVTELSKEQRKALLSCILPVMANVRQFRSSEHIKKQLKKLLPEESEQEIAEIAQKIDYKNVPEQHRKNLVSILNKMTVCQNTKVRGIFGKYLKNVMKRKTGYWSNADDEELRELWDKSRPLGCTGCFITDARDALARGEPIPAISDNYVLDPCIIAAE